MFDLDKFNLYHYTNAEAALLILKNRELWLSEIRSLNDPRELVFGQDTFGPLILEWIETNFREPERRAISAQFIGKFAYDAVQNSFFSASFCPDPNNNHLWTEYSANNSGVAIGFHPAIIEQFGALNYVTYIDPSESNFRAETLKRFDERFGPLKDMFAVRPPSMVIALMGLYLLTKEKTWADEREHRVVWAQTKPTFRTFPPESLQSDGQRRYWPIYTRGTSGEIEYITRKHPDLYYSYNSVREIVLGSSCSINEKDLIKSLNNWGCPPIPIRRNVI